MKLHRNCVGHSRRDFLRVGALSATSFTLASYLRMAAAGDIAPATAQAAIFVDLPGGPSHIDTFDLKEHAPAEVRGQFASIATNVPGIRICEHLPKLAQCADKFAILRGVSHTLADHRSGAEVDSGDGHG